MRFSYSLRVALGALIILSAGCKDTTQPEPVSANPPTSPPPAPPPPTPPPGLGEESYLYIASADGSAITLLGRGFAPTWSPSGERIAYQSHRDGDAEIFVVNADGSGETQLTQNTDHDRKPRWSPRGDRIAFTKDRAGGGGPVLYVMNTDGTSVTALTSEAIDADFVYQGHPLWSPDGRRLAFTFRTRGDAPGGIAVINEDGSGLIPLTSETMGASSPDWSPDGRRIAFHAGGATYVMNADGSGLMKLTPGEAVDFEPAWSPDGNKIAVARDITGEIWWDAGGSIWLMNPDGTEAAELTGARAWGTLQWFPDGRHIVYSLGRSVEAVPLSTGVPKTLVRGGFDARPSPDGTRIVFVTGSPL